MKKYIETQTIWDTESKDDKWPTTAVKIKVKTRSDKVQDLVEEFHKTNLEDAVGNVTVKVVSVSKGAFKVFQSMFPGHDVEER